MADILTKAQRSALMAKVKGRGNASTELRLIAVFRALGITGWRRGITLIGRPDFVFPKLRIAVFVDGCFWHGCPIHATQPKQNAEFWRAKIARNQARDLLVTRQLRACGWRVLRFWEHELTRKYETRFLTRLRNSTLLTYPPLCLRTKPGGRAQAASLTPHRPRSRISRPAHAEHPHRTEILGKSPKKSG